MKFDEISHIFMSFAHRADPELGPTLGMAGLHYFFSELRIEHSRGLFVS